MLMTANQEIIHVYFKYFEIYYVYILRWDRFRYSTWIVFLLMHFSGDSYSWLNVVAERRTLAELIAIF